MGKLKQKIGLWLLRREIQKTTKQAIQPDKLDEAIKEYVSTTIKANADMLRHARKINTATLIEKQTKAVKATIVENLNPYLERCPICGSEEDCDCPDEEEPWDNAPETPDQMFMNILKTAMAGKTTPPESVITTGGASPPVTPVSVGGVPPKVAAVLQDNDSVNWLRQQGYPI